jgi:hypothetical protein
VLVRDELRARGRAARIETAWVRPGWPVLWALLCALGATGSVVAVREPIAGLAMTGAALVLLSGEVSGTLTVLRLLLPRRATAVLVSEPLPPRPARLLAGAGPAGPPRVRLIVTAPLDAPRGSVAARLGDRLPAVVVLAAALVTAVAGARVAGLDGTGLGIVALVPTIVLVVAVAAYLDLDQSRAGREADAAGVALALVAALDAEPPHQLAVELVLAGPLGFAAYVRARRGAARPSELAVLALGTGRGAAPRVHPTEGVLPPRRLHPGLVAAARAAGLDPVRRRTTGALAARRAGWPALGLSTGDPVVTTERCRAIVALVDAQLT